MGKAMSVSAAAFLERMRAISAARMAAAERSPPPGVETGAAEAPESRKSSVTITFTRNPKYIDYVQFMCTSTDAKLCGACAVNNALQEDLRKNDTSEREDDSELEDRKLCKRSDRSEIDILLEVFRRFPESERCFPGNVGKLEREKSRIKGLIAKVDRTKEHNCKWVALRPFDTQWILLDSLQNGISIIPNLAEFVSDYMKGEDCSFIAVHENETGEPEVGPTHPGPTMKRRRRASSRDRAP